MGVADGTVVGDKLKVGVSLGCMVGGKLTVGEALGRRDCVGGDVGA